MYVRLCVRECMHCLYVHALCGSLCLCIERFTERQRQDGHACMHSLYVHTLCGSLSLCIERFTHSRESMYVPSHSVCVRVTRAQCVSESLYVPVYVHIHVSLYVHWVCQSLYTESMYVSLCVRESVCESVCS